MDTNITMSKEKYDEIVTRLEEVQKQVESCNSLIRTLTGSRNFWRRMYYKERKRNGVSES